MHRLTFPSFAQSVKGFGISVLVILAIASVVTAQTQHHHGHDSGHGNRHQRRARAWRETSRSRNLDTNLSKTLIRRWRALRSIGSSSRQLLGDRSKKGFATTVVEKTELTVGQALTFPLSMSPQELKRRVTVTVTA